MKTKKKKKIATKMRLTGRADTEPPVDEKV